MNLELFIKGRYTLVWSILIYLAGVYLMTPYISDFAPDHTSGLLFSSADQWIRDITLSRIVNTLLILSGGILLLRINARFSLIRKHTLLLLIFFLLLELSTPQLTRLCNGNILALVLLSTLLLLFHTYQQEHAQPAFLIIGILSLCTLFCTASFYYIPLYIIGFAQLRYISPKSLLGGLVGFITPFWILTGLGIIPLSQLAGLFTFSSWGMPDVLPCSYTQLSIIALTAALGLFSGVATLHSTFNEKRQIRACNGFINLLSVYTAILLFLDFKNYMLYLPVLNTAVSIQAAFFFTNYTKRWTALLFYLVMAAYIALLILNLSPAA